MFELILSEYRSDLQHVLVFLICGGALIWGGGPERAVAVTWLIAIEATDVVAWLWGLEGTQLLQVDTVLAGGDIVAGVAWVTIALYANRNYPLWIAGLQVLAMTAHLARGLSDVISPIAYLTMIYAPGWLQLIFLGIGLVRHVRRKRRYGPYRDWRLVRNPPAFLTLFGGTRVIADRAKPDDRTSSWRDELK